MKSYQQRVIDEKAQLDERIIKLEAFLNTGTFKSLNFSEQFWLEKQFGVMADYSYVLGERIRRFRD